MFTTISHFFHAQKAPVRHTVVNSIHPGATRRKFHKLHSRPFIKTNPKGGQAGAGTKGGGGL